MLQQFTITNYLDNTDTAAVIPLNSADILSDKNLQQLVTICNQEAIYDILFRKRLDGRPYQLSDATGFVDRAIKGWAEGTTFVYIIKNTNTNDVIGAIDIKSNNLDGAEVGYWQDVNSPGYMTNALIGLIEQTATAGYKQLYALVVPDNSKSKGVVTRAGFVPSGQVTENDKLYDKFVVSL